MPLRTDLRLRRPLPGLLRLPWDKPLAEWQPEDAALREMPVGPSRHLVRFVEADGRMWAIKELPERVDELAAEDPDVAEYIQRLEAAQDEEDLPAATGDSIAAEFQRYLRRRNEGH